MFETNIFKNVSFFFINILVIIDPANKNFETDFITARLFCFVHLIVLNILTITQNPLAVHKRSCSRLIDITKIVIWALEYVAKLMPSGLRETASAALEQLTLRRGLTERKKNNDFFFTIKIS